MRKSIFLVIALLAATLAPSSFAATKTVDITRLGFTPDRLTIDPGDTVTWTNKDSAQHQVVADQTHVPDLAAVLQANQAYSTGSSSPGRSATATPSLATSEGGSSSARASRCRCRHASSASAARRRLSGAVSSGQAGETVTRRGPGVREPEPPDALGAARSGANGAWSLAVKPTLNTVYECAGGTRRAPVRSQGRAREPCSPWRSRRSRHV